MLDSQNDRDENWEKPVCKQRVREDGGREMRERESHYNLEAHTNFSCTLYAFGLH